MTLLLTALFSLQARKSGTVADDGSAVSTKATAVFRIRAEAEATWVQTVSSEPLGHSSPYLQTPLAFRDGGSFVRHAAGRSQPNSARNNSMLLVSPTPERFGVTVA